MNFNVSTIYNGINEQEWNRLVERSDYSSVFQTPHALQFFKKVRGHEPLVVACMNNNMKIDALMCGVLMAETGLKKKLSSRIIIFGGPLINPECRDKTGIMDLLLKKYIEMYGHRAIYIETRNMNDYSDFKDIFETNGWKYHQHYNFRVDCSNLDLLKKQMSDSKIRQVNKSIKSGAYIKEAETVSEIRSFYNILRSTYKNKVKTPLPGLEFFLAMFTDRYAHFFLVMLNEQVIGGIVSPVLDKKVIYEWYVCGEDGKHQGVYPSVMATWAAIEYAHKNKIPVFDFMGAGKPDASYGVRDFKSKFGGELVEYGRFLYVSKPQLYRLGKIGIKMMKKL